MILPKDKENEVPYWQSLVNEKLITNKVNIKTPFVLRGYLPSFKFLPNTDCPTLLYDLSYIMGGM